MNIRNRGVFSQRQDRPLGTALARGGLVFLSMSLLACPLSFAHSPLMDADLTDWCVGAFSNTAPGGGRVEDSSATLVCGNCDTTIDLACQINSDCPAGETCINLTSKTEVVWWDNRTDGAVNDLGTVVTTFDNNNLYFAAELWVDPDPVSLPFGQIAIDFTSGGIDGWYDPGAPVNGFQPQLTNAGRCSVSTDRGCTSDQDCHFCAISTEPTGACSITTAQTCASNSQCPAGETCVSRVRACGSSDVICSDLPGDNCLAVETCVDLGTLGALNRVGLNSNPTSLPDYLVLFDFSRWLAGSDATALFKNIGGEWVNQGLVAPAVNPGASGGSGGPPGSVEVALPWSLFGCTGCPDACVCPDFGPGQDYRYAMIIARGASDLDFAPDGAIEDTMSEAVGGTTTTTTNSCPGFGIGNTSCEIADGSVDSFVPLPPGVPGGRTDGLRMSKNAAPSISLTWNRSCSTADTDFEIYEGEIGIWYSHVQVTGLCTTGGATAATFDAAAGNRYYLVVPSDGNTEGSYGEDSSLLERPVSTDPCRAQSLGTCP